jgi:hypothetical protein
VTRPGNALLGAMLVLAGCSQTSVEPPFESMAPRQVDAVYALMFNDSLVGQALFSLDLQQDGKYRIEAFTTPAGKIATQAINEVLEVSEGRFEGAEILPDRFEHSVLLGEGYRHVRIDFDWDRPALDVSHGDAHQTLALLPGTQDRLSYLLAAAQLSRGEDDVRQSIRLASLEATEPAELELIGQQSVAVPFGTFDAVGVRRVSPENEERREIWYSTDTDPLPLKVLRQHDGNTIQMQLESFSVAQPVPD